jgi:hypothetical protein
MTVLHRSFKMLFVASLLLLSVGLVSAQERLIADSSSVSSSSSFLHSSVPSSNINNWTVFNSPLTANNSNAIVFYTHNWNPDGNPGGTDVVPYPLGVWYNGSQWSLFNQDQSIPFVADTYFNIMAQGIGGNVFTHTSTPGNISADATIIDHPLTNSNPNALLFVAPNWTASPVYHTHSVGVFYDTDIQRWLIFNQDSSFMPGDIAFNVMVKTADDVSFNHTKAAGDNALSESYTPLDNPYLNGNPYAQVIVTQVYGVRNDSEVGVWYDNGTELWYIYNEDLTSIPSGVKFNIHVTSVDWDNRNLLINSGFEVPGAASSQPLNWTIQDKAKRKCDNLVTGKAVSVAGECATLMKGKPGFNTQIKQAGAVSSIANGASLLGHFTGKNVFGGLKATVKMTLSNGSDQKIALDSTMLNSGTYDLQLEQFAVLPTNAVSFKVKVKLLAPTGKVFVDEMGLYSVYPLRSEEASLAVLPLPGFEGAATASGSGGPTLGQTSIAQTITAGIPGR